MVRKHPDQIVPLMDKWIVSEDMWLRRTAIIHQLRYKADTDTDRLFRLRHTMFSQSTISVRGRSQLSTFMKAYTAYARGVGPPYAFFPENQHLILITDNVL